MATVEKLQEHLKKTQSDLEEAAKNNSDALELLKCFNMPFLGREES